MRFTEGIRVAYIGEPDGGIAFEEQGVVMSAEANGSYVKWSTGAQADDITYVANHWLTPTAGTAVESSVLDDSLDEGSMIPPGQVTAAFNAYGPLGVWSMLRDDGHLIGLDSSVEEIVTGVMARVRHDASVRETLAHLDDEDGEQFVSLVASRLMRQAAEELVD
jgi:hypothetical protein